MKNILFSLLIILTGCSSNIQRFDYTDYINKINKLESDRVKEDVVVFPVYDSKFQWISPISGRDLLNKINFKDRDLKYESTNEYKNRNSGIDGLIFSMYSNWDFDYNPDTEILSFPDFGSKYLSSLAATYTVERDYHDVSMYIGIPVSTDLTRKVGGYYGSNVFGVTEYVTKHKSEIYNVVPYKKHNINEIDKLIFTNECKVDVNEFRKFHSKISVQFLFKLIYPYVKRDENYVTPTIDNPIKNDISIYMFRTEIIAARLVNKESGNIYNCKIGMSRFWIDT